MDEKTRLLIKQMSREVADEMAKLLRQEYKWHEDAWWLFTLGRPARPLTEDEIQYAKNQGDIQDDPR